jgi:hypothetical protein
MSLIFFCFKAFYLLSVSFIKVWSSFVDKVFYVIVFGCGIIAFWIKYCFVTRLLVFTCTSCWGLTQITLCSVFWHSRSVFTDELDHLLCK